MSPSQVRLRVVPDTGRSSIHPFVKQKVKAGGVLVTDEWFAYRGIVMALDHRIVDHGRGQYVNENGNTINAIEGFWSHCKRGILGIYHHVSPKHLQRYAEEFGFHNYTKLMNNHDRFKLAIEGSRNTRLPYVTLIR